MRVFEIVSLFLTATCMIMPRPAKDLRNAHMMHVWGMCPHSLCSLGSTCPGEPAGTCGGWRWAAAGEWTAGQPTFPDRLIFVVARAATPPARQAAGSAPSSVRWRWAAAKAHGRLVPTYEFTLNLALSVQTPNPKLKLSFFDRQWCGRARQRQRFRQQRLALGGSWHTWWSSAGR